MQKNRVQAPAPINRLIVFAEYAKQFLGAGMLLTFLVIAGLLFYAFVGEIFAVLRTHLWTIDHGFLHALGTLLVLWTVIELIHAEVEVLRGHKFGVSVLIDVVMAATVRKLLLSDFHANSELYGYLLALVSLAVVRYMLARSTNASVV